MPTHAQTLDSLSPNDASSLEQYTLSSLPVNNDVRLSAISALRALHGSAELAAKVLEADPAQCALIVGTTNQLIEKKSNKVHTLTHAISILGIPKTESLLRQAKELTPSTIRHYQEYQQQLNISLHAAYQARDWATKQSSWNPNEAFCAALLFAAPIWHLWVTQGESMSALQQTNLNTPTSQKLQQKMLGERLSTFAEKLSQQWQLTPTSVDAWQYANTTIGNDLTHLYKLPTTSFDINFALEENHRLSQLFSKTTFPVLLSNYLAHEASRDWHSPHTKRAIKFLSFARLKNYQHCLHECQQTAIHYAQQAFPKDSLNVGKSLLFIRSTVDKPALRVRTSNNVTAPSKSPTVISTPSEKQLTRTEKISRDLKKTQPLNQRNTPPKSAPVTILTDATQQLMSDAKAFRQLSDIFQFSIDSLQKLPGARQCCVFMLSTRNRTITAINLGGAPSHITFTNFHHTFCKTDLFSKLSQKPTSLRLYTDNQSKLWPMLPNYLKPRIPNNNFLMMSLFSQQKPLAVLYMDGDDNFTCNTHNFSAFKKLGRAMEHCINKQHE